MNQPLDSNKKPNANQVGTANSFSDYIRKVQRELSDDYLIEVYVSLYLRALRSDGVLNYEEKVWFADRVRELYDIDVFKQIQSRYTREEFIEHAKKSAHNPLDLTKITNYFIKEKKQDLCYELACFAAYTADRDFSELEKKFLNELGGLLELSEAKQTEIETRFKS